MGLLSNNNGQERREVTMAAVRPRLAVALAVAMTILPLPVFSQTQTPSPSGLISFWPGEGDAGDLVGDNAGTLLGGVTFAPGKVGQAFNLNGVNQYVRVPNSASLNPTGSFSIEAWIYVVNGNSYNIIMNKWADSGVWDNQRSYTFHVNPGGVLTFGISDAANQWNTRLHDFLTPENTVPLNAWTHVAAVYDQATGTRRMYVNGVKVASRTDAPITVLNSIADVSIGAWLEAPGLARWHFGGKIDELAFYNRALSDAEIQARYQTDNSVILSANRTAKPAAGPSVFRAAVATPVNEAAIIDPQDQALPPSLTITTANGNVLISRPVSTAQFTLEGLDLMTSTNWTPVTAAPMTNATGITVTVPASAAQQFYRLRLN